MTSVIKPRIRWAMFATVPHFTGSNTFWHLWLHFTLKTTSRHYPHFIDEKAVREKIGNLFQGHRTWLWQRETLSGAISGLIASPQSECERGRVSACQCELCQCEESVPNSLTFAMSAFPDPSFFISQASDLMCCLALQEPLTTWSYLNLN